MTINRIFTTVITALVMVLFSALPASSMKITEVMSDVVSVEVQKGDTVGSVCFAILPLPTRHIVYGPGGCVQSVAKYRNPHLVKVGETISIPFRLPKASVLLAAVNKPIWLPEKTLAPAESPKVSEPADKQVVLVGSDEGRRVPNSKPLTIPSDPLAESRRELQTLVGDLRVNNQNLNAQLAQAQANDAAKAKLLNAFQTERAQFDRRLVGVQQANNGLAAKIRDLGATISTLRGRINEADKALKIEASYKGQYVFWKLTTWATIAVAVVLLCALAFFWYREDRRLVRKLKTAETDRNAAHAHHVRVEEDREVIQAEKNELARQLEAANAEAEKLRIQKTELAAKLAETDQRHQHLSHQVGDRILFATGNDGEITAVVGKIISTQSLKGKRRQKVFFHPLDGSEELVRWEDMPGHIAVVFPQDNEVDNGVDVGSQTRGKNGTLAEASAKKTPLTPIETI